VSLLTLENFDADLFSVKESRSKIEYYFTITPCLINFLLKTVPETDLITYLDADIYFFDSPERIFEPAKDASVIIVSHHFSEKNKHLERFGKYNVVFNSFRNDEEGLKILQWWRESCINWCFDYFEDGKYADQKYLDEFEKLSPKVYVENDIAVNLAGFNVDNADLQYKNSDILVNGNKLVFYHFHRLKKIKGQFFEMYPRSHWGATLSKNAVIIKIYTRYIRAMLFFEKKYHLQFENSVRYDKSPFSLFDKIIFDYPIYVNSFFSVVLHGEKYYRIYRKIKSFFVKNNQTAQSTKHG
jgi:hypothetical protein